MALVQNCFKRHGDINGDVISGDVLSGDVLSGDVGLMKMRPVKTARRGSRAWLKNLCRDPRDPRDPCVLLVERVIAITIASFIASLQNLCCNAEICGNGGANNLSIWHSRHSEMEQEYGVIWIFRHKC